MESLKRLVRNAERKFQQTVQNIVASILRTLSDISRIHIMIVHGDAVFGALCSLESSDMKGMQRAMRLCESDTREVPIRTRVFGDYSLTLVVLEWPLNPSEGATDALVGILLELLAQATTDQKHVDGITLIAEESTMSFDLNFNSCFVKTYIQLELTGHHPLAVLQHCERGLTLPFNVLHFEGDFITSESLHQLLSKKVDPSQK